MAAITTAVVVGAGTAAYSARQARNASRAQVGASNRAIDVQQASEARALEMQRPFYEAGYAATAAMMDMAGLDRSREGGGGSTGEFDVNTYLRDNPDVASDKRWGYDPEGHYEQFGRFEGRARPAVSGTNTADLSSYARYNWQTDPGYQFRLDEGMRTLERGAAARGILNSGGTIRSATRYAQDYASNEYQRVFDRIATIAGRGQSAANAGSNVVVNTGESVGRALINAGESRASGYVAQGNAWANFANQGAALYGYMNAGGGSRPSPSTPPYAGGTIDPYGYYGGNAVRLS